MINLRLFLSRKLKFSRVERRRDGRRRRRFVRFDVFCFCFVVFCCVMVWCVLYLFNF